MGNQDNQDVKMMAKSASIGGGNQDSQDMMKAVAELKATTRHVPIYAFIGGFLGALLAVLLILLLHCGCACVTH